MAKVSLVGARQFEVIGGGEDGGFSEKPCADVLIQVHRCLSKFTKNFSTKGQTILDCIVLKPRGDAFHVRHHQGQIPRRAHAPKRSLRTISE